MKRITPKDISRVLRKHHYIPNSHYLSNIVIIRNNHPVQYQFNDLLYIICDEVLRPSTYYRYNVTASPALFKLSTLNTLRNHIIKEGQYINALHLVQPSVRQKRLDQIEPITLFNTQNPADERTDLFNISILPNTSSHDPFKPKDWNPANIIFEDPSEYRQFISFCQVAARYNTNRFTLTILNLAEFYPLDPIP